jgi:FkbM family methyltransferase
MATSVAIRIRNQSERIIGEHLSAGPDMRTNGEALLARTVCPRVSTFIDVGANTGDWTALVLEYAPTAHGLLFEPSQSAVNRLRQRFRAGFDLEILQVALSDRSGSAQLFEEPEAGQSSSFVAGHSRATAVPHNVSVRTLDHELQTRSWDSVGILKIDTEGYDLRVIKGALPFLETARIGVLQFEYNRPWAAAGSTLGDAITLLRDCGYSIYLLLPQGLYRFDYERYREFYAYSNFVAISKDYRQIVQRLVVGGV